MRLLANLLSVEELSVGPKEKVLPLVGRIAVDSSRFELYDLLSI